MAETIEIPKEEGPTTWQNIDDALLGGVQLEIVDSEPETEVVDEPATEAVETQEVEPEADAPPEPAEKQDVDYAMEIEVPITDGSEKVNVTVGELKDQYEAFQRRETDIQKREADIASEYGQLARMNAEMQANGAPLNEQQQHQVQQMQAARVQREAQLMLDTIPEWKDQASFQKDRQEIVEIMKPYGITEQMINGVADHRIALLYKHHLDLVRRVQRAEAIKPDIAPVKKVPKGKKPAHLSKARATDKLVQHAQASGNENTQMAAIDALIRG